MITQRRAVSAEKREAAADAARKLLLTHHLFTQSQHIACYFPRGDEFDCFSIIKEVWQSGKQCYLPVLSRNKDKHLFFAQYDHTKGLRPNRYQIFEPDDSEIIPLENLDLVIVPLVGFDLQGNRLGLGAGFYDKTFSFLLEKKCEKPYLLGLAYELQQVDSLPTDGWDVPLRGVLTEERLYSL